MLEIYVCTCCVEYYFWLAFIKGLNGKVTRMSLTPFIMNKGFLTARKSGSRNGFVVIVVVAVVVLVVGLFT